LIVARRERKTVAEKGRADSGEHARDAQALHESLWRKADAVSFANPVAHPRRIDLKRVAPPSCWRFPQRSFCTFLSRRLP
jgi:hypothetical protein